MVDNLEYLLTGLASEDYSGSIICIVEWVSVLIQSSAGADNTNRLIVAEVEEIRRKQDHGEGVRPLIPIQDRADVIEGHHRIVSLFRQLGVST